MDQQVRQKIFPAGALVASQRKIHTILSFVIAGMIAEYGCIIRFAKSIDCLCQIFRPRNMRTDKNSDPAVWQFRESVSPHNSADLADRGQFFYRINLAVNCGKIDMDRLLQLPKEMPTAFVCNCDLTASFLIRRLHEHGYRVPEDISVVGYDNYLFPGLCDVAITTYEVDMKEMARQTVHTLIRKMAGEPYRQGICIVEGHMVTKDSVKARKNMG